MNNVYIYPVIIAYDSNEKDFPYFVTIPDIDGYTQGTTLGDAIEMARDYIGNYLIELDGKGLEFPDASPLPQSKNTDEIVTLVDIDFVKFKAKDDNKFIKKTLTIPNYLNNLATEQGINFSQTLAEALKEKLGV